VLNVARYEAKSSHAHQAWSAVLKTKTYMPGVLKTKRNKEEYLRTSHNVGDCNISWISRRRAIMLCPSFSSTPPSHDTCSSTRCNSGYIATCCAGRVEVYPLPETRAATNILLLEKANAEELIAYSSQNKDKTKNHTSQRPRNSKTRQPQTRSRTLVRSHGRPRR